MNWLLLIYKIPREPTASRVYIWRKLKQLGAISVQDAIWVLPANARTQEHFQWLASEIIELHGEATIFQSQLIFPTEGSPLREQFEAPVRDAYQEIMINLKRRRPDLANLSKKYQLAKDQDYFHCELGERVRRKLLDAQKGKP